MLSSAHFQLLTVYLSLVCVSTRKCIPIEPLKDYQVEKDMGMWYMMAFDSNRYCINIKCFNTNFTFIEPNIINGYAQITGTLYGNVFNIDTNLTFVGDLKVAQFKQNYQEVMRKGTMDTKVVATDYETYIIFYSCKGNQQAFLVIYTRSPIIDDAIIKKTYDVVESIGLPSDELILCDQTNCPY